MKIRLRYATPLLAAGAVAAAIVSTPVAGAQTPRSCTDAGTAVTCSTNGSVSITAVPAVQAPSATPYFPLSRGIGGAANALGGAAAR